MTKLCLCGQDVVEGEEYCQDCLEGLHALAEIERQERKEGILFDSHTEIEG